MNTEQGYLLVVEDDPDILKLLDTTLKFRGYHVVTAHNGRDALEFIQRERPATIIADIMMPKLDGFGLVHRLRINPETRDIPVIFITATYVTLEDREFAMNIGATRFLQKPVDLEKFLKTIDEVLHQGSPVAFEPLKEFSFYNTYRVRLEKKLEQKNKQIARYEYSLGNPREDEKIVSLRASLQKTIDERDELKLLLDQVFQQIERYTTLE